VLALRLRLHPPERRLRRTTTVRASRTLTGGVLGNRAIGADDVTRLATLPPREVLLAKLAGGMQAPVATLAGLFAAPLRNLGYALQQVAEQKAKAGPPAA